MKKTIVFSVILGVVFSLIMYLNYYKNNNLKKINTSSVYFLQVGVYKNAKNVTNITKILPHYLVIEKDNLYHVYVGISKNKENIEKIKVFYNQTGNNIYVDTLEINCDKFIKKLDTYDYLINASTNMDAINVINKEVLKSYEENCSDNKGNATL